MLRELIELEDEISRCESMEEMIELCCGAPRMDIAPSFGGGNRFLLEQERAYPDIVLRAADGVGPEEAALRVAKALLLYIKDGKDFVQYLTKAEKILMCRALRALCPALRG